MTATLVIDRRFNGPPGSANGGYAAGRLAASVDADVVEVTLRAPPPLGRELAVEAGEGGAAMLRDGDTLVAEARPGTLTAVPPAPPSPVAASAASRESTFGPDHPFPSCFVCGPGRAEGDGLRLFAGPVGERLWAATWTPGPSLAGDDGAVRPEFAWAALDCPSAVPVANERMTPPVVLGRITARLDGPVAPGRPHVVAAWPLAVDGRKRTAGSALFTEDGELLALAEAVWIELR